MEAALIIDDRQFWIVKVEEPGDFALPFGRVLYPCLVYANKPTSQEFKATISRMLIESDCRYAVCAGLECEVWHDMVDWSYLETDPDFDPPNTTLVMTTWHDLDTLEDVVFFFAMNTNFDGHSFRKYLILLVGSDPMLENEIASWIRVHLEKR